MTLTSAMFRAMELHQPHTLPRLKPWEDDSGRAEAFTALNRTRASLTSDDWPAKVLAFHRLYNVPVGNQGTLAQIDAYRRVLRRRLLEEEVKEALDADESGDLIELIDGLLDTVYVAIGWLLELGLTPVQVNLLMEEVHASNCTKVDNNGQPVFDEGGKVLKGDNYVRVNLPLVLDLEEPSHGQRDPSLPG